MSVAFRVKTTAFVFQTLSVCSVTPVCADQRVEFNTDVLDAADRSHIDLSRFSTDNYISPGDYLLDIRVNGQSLGQEKVRYVNTAPDRSAEPCISDDLLDKLALKDETRQRLTRREAQCTLLSSLPGAQLRTQAGMLDITVPQAWMKYNDPDWTPPERWDNGVAGLIFDYNLNGQLTRQFDRQPDTRSLSGYGQAGVNLGAWRLRGEYQTSYYSQPRRFQYDWNQFYAFRPLPQMAATLTLGEMYLNSQLFSSVRFTGANLASDERMLPPALQGYAPEIHGIANGNAKVIVSQSGRVIYETTVPAGPFNIQDLRSSVRGTLDVRVEEQDGSVKTFQVNTADIPYLTRPGYVRYNLAAGSPSTTRHRVQGPAFASGDFSWGVSNAWSLYGGLQSAGEDYTATSLGIGRDLNRFGALSLDATESFSRQRNGQRLQGASWKLSYAKTFDEYHSAITFAGYRFSQKDFRTLAQHLDDRDRSLTTRGREKEMYTVTANKTFWAERADRATTLFLSWTHQNYWDRQQRDRYGVAVGRSFSLGDTRGISANLSAWRADYRGRQDDSLALSLSIPLGDSKWAGLDVQTDGGRTSPMASWTDNSDANNLWRLRAGASQQGRGSVDGYYQRRAALAEMTGSASYQQDRFIALGGSLRGGFTATRYGAALHNGGGTLNTARIMVDTNGIADVPLNDKRSRTNRFGIAVVPDIVSYNRFDTRVDVDAMADNIEPAKAISTTTLTEGAIGYQTFGMAKGLRMMATLQLADGSAPPFGAELFNRDGISVAMVLDDGLAWLAGVNPQETLSVNWGGKTQCHVTLPATIDDRSVGTRLRCQ
ncbi:fimbria/pilus outer membrane usher protein [Pantoea sp. 1.19]|uniref:fimbria/pilus outer membrane usher protein n=1 Tax=Pantoea sp. 1.19 TaxID=1925589 RepID=UPI000948EDF1|nr:fimbria/pilus outer membrane usher protein [Pantoea sp. 1.19]